MNNTLYNWVRNKGMIIFLLFIMLFESPFQIKADDTLDSLSAMLSDAKDDTIKVNLLIQLTETFSPAEYDQALINSKACLVLSEELDYPRGKLFAYRKLGTLYKNIGEFDSALYYIDKAINIAEEIGNTKQHAANLNIYGSLLRRKGFYSSALDAHEKSLALSQYMNDKQGIANSYIYIAIIHEMRLNYDTAIYYYYKSMRMYEELENNRNIGVALLNIGDLYESLQDYHNAKTQYKAALILFEELEDLRYIGMSNNKIGIVYSDFGKYDSALYHYRISQTYYDSIENKSGIAHIDINMGNLYLRWGKYDSANYYFNKAKSSFKQMDFKRGYLNALLSQAELYAKKGEQNISLKIYDTCQEIASQVSAHSLLNVYSGIFNIYENSGNYKKAFEYQTKYYEVNDSVFNLEKTEIITDLTFKYEKEKDEARILILENENLAKNLSLRKRTNQRNIYLFSGIGIIVVILFIFIFYRQKARKDKIIAEQKIQQLEEEKKLLAAKFLVEGQEEERKRIAKELHDGLGVLLSTTKIQFTSIKEKSPENKEIIDKATQMLEQATGDVRKISHNMMPGLLTRFGLYEAAEDLIDSLNETKGLNAACEIKGDTKRLPENTEIMLYRIIQEMVNNTIKHAEAKNIQLQINIFSEKLDITFSDDGKGFIVEEKMQLKSIGLNSIQSRVNFLSGNVKLESEPGKGVKYTIHIPMV